MRALVFLEGRGNVKLDDCMLRHRASLVKWADKKEASALVHEYISGDSKDWPPEHRDAVVLKAESPRIRDR